MQITIYATSKLKQFRKLRKLKKEHRNLKVIQRGVYSIEHGYEGNCTCIHWMIVEYED